MKIIPVEIRKNSPTHCSEDCLFRNVERDENGEIKVCDCNLFRQELHVFGDGVVVRVEACEKCEERFGDLYE